MPRFSTISMQRLASCHSFLQDLLNDVIRHVDCSILCGYRGEDEQNAAFAAGNTQKKWPESKHNRLPSLAVDAAPYLNGKPSEDKTQCVFFAGIVMGIALKRGIKIRLGSDWDQDFNVMDQSQWDPCHFELVV